MVVVYGDGSYGKFSYVKLNWIGDHHTKHEHQFECVVKEHVWKICGHCVMHGVSNAQITIKAGYCEDDQNGEARSVQHSMPRNKLMWSFHATFNWHHLKNCGKCSCSKRGSYYPNKN